MSADYSPNPLVKKLGLKDNIRALLIGVPNNQPEILNFPDYLHCEHTLAEGLRDRDYIHWFTSSRQDIDFHIHLVSRRLCADGMLWLSWPKKASKVQTDVTEDVLRTLILPTSLVDVKVCAIDDVWSGLKFMWRNDHRKKLI